MRELSLLVLLSASFAFADGRSLCLMSKELDHNLPSAAWIGKRFALTWYATEQGKQASLEQKFALVEPEGELVGSKFPLLTPADGFASVMGRLRVGPSGTLGLVWQDDASGQRTAMFRTLDFDGKPKTDPMKLWKDKVPHGDQSALAWNGKTKKWLAVLQGTEPTSQPGSVTHHLYGLTFASAPGSPPVRLDADESIGSSHSLVVEPKGECGITAWENASAVVIGTFCGEKVQRQTVTDQTTKRPMQPTLAARPDGSVLVAWIEEAPREAQPAPKAAGSNGTAPSQPWNAPPPPGLPRTSVSFVLLDPAGTVKVRGRLDGGGHAQSPAVTASESGWFVVWTDGNLSTHLDVATAARISPEGNQQGPLMRLHAPAASPQWVSVASSGTKSYVLISHPNHPDCAVEWVELR